MDRDLPADPPRRAVPAVRRADREPRRPPAARRQGRHQRRHARQLPHDAGQPARGGPRDVRGARAQHRAAARQRRQPAAGQPLRLARRQHARPDRRPHRRRGGARPGRDPLGSLRAVALSQEVLRATQARRRPPIGASTARPRRQEPHAGSAGPTGRAQGARPLSPYAHGERSPGTAGRPRRQARPAAVLEQLPRPRRSPARARGGRGRRDALGRRRGRVAARVGEHDAAPAAGGADRRVQGDAERACCSAPATWPTSAIVPALARKGEIVFSDELNHASIIDGCRLAGRGDVRLPPRRRRPSRVGPAQRRRARRADRHRRRVLDGRRRRAARGDRRAGAAPRRARDGRRRARHRHAGSRRARRGRRGRARGRGRRDRRDARQGARAPTARSPRATT